MAADLDVPGFRECSRTPELTSALYHDGGKHAVAAVAGKARDARAACPKEKGPARRRRPLELLVGAIGFEPTTL